MIPVLYHGPCVATTGPVSVPRSLCRSYGTRVGTTVPVSVPRSLYRYHGPLVVTTVLCRQAYHCRRQRALYPPLRYLLLGLLPGATIAAAGLVTYTLLETEENYKYTHSAWHCCIALSILFLLPARRPVAGSDYYGLQENGAGSDGKLVRTRSEGQRTANTTPDSERASGDGRG